MVTDRAGFASGPWGRRAWEGGWGGGACLEGFSAYAIERAPKANPKNPTTGSVADDPYNVQVAT